jgi:hypothetical protein
MLGTQANQCREFLVLTCMQNLHLVDGVVASLVMTNDPAVGGSQGQLGTFALLVAPKAQLRESSSRMID